MSVVIDRIEIEDDYIRAYYSYDNMVGVDEDDYESGIEEFKYNENSALALAVDLISRLILMQVANANGDTISPANNMEID